MKSRNRGIYEEIDAQTDDIRRAEVLHNEWKKQRRAAWMDKHHVIRGLYHAIPFVLFIFAIAYFVARAM